MPANDLQEITQVLLKGDRSALARSITLIESQRDEDRAASSVLLDACSEVAVRLHRRAPRIAITGAPGVGKSTLINRLGLKWISEGHKVAVLAVDPSSRRTGGSLLGDKTRMGDLAQHPDAFIRPSPTSGHLGGVASATREGSLLCEAAGFDVVIIETVGVGQSEDAVRDMVDVVIFVTMTDSGDELQGIKRGILEGVDVVVVNKADGDHLKAAQRFAGQLDQALHLLRGADHPAVLCASAIEDRGIAEIVRHVETSLSNLEESGELSAQRDRQRLSWFGSATRQLLNRHVDSIPTWKEERLRLNQAVLEGAISPWKAAEELVRIVFPSSHSQLNDSDT